MYCKNCGNKISEGAKFCKSCGAPAVEPSEKRETEQARRESIRREKAKKRRKILLACLLLLAVCACVVFAYVKPNWIDRKTAKPEDGKPAAAALAKGETGNSFANLANGGELVESGSWIYYSNGQGIYKTADMSEEGTQLCRATVPGNLNAAGEWIYYTAAKGTEHYNVIYRVRMNGSESEMLSEEPCTMLTAAGDKLYYQIVDQNSEGYEGKLFSMNMDGSGVKQVLEDQIRFLGIEKDWIYYTTYQGEQNTLYRVKTDGTEEERLISEFRSCSVPVVKDGWLYYGRAAEDGSWKLCRQKLSADGKREDIVQAAASSSYWEIALNVCDGWVYYVDLGNTKDTEEPQERVCRVKVDGSEPELMSDGGWSCRIFTADQDVMCCFSKNSADELENWQLEWEVME